MEDIFHIYKEALLQFHQGLVIIDESERVQFVNTAFLNMGGYIEGELINKKITSFIEQTDQSLNWHGEIPLKTKNGVCTKWIKTLVLKQGGGDRSFSMLLFSDIEEKELDALTKLPNRFSLHQQLDQVLDKSRERDLVFAVLFLDLDRFKFVNDTLGHSYGDLLLQQAAARIQDCLGNRHLLARMGGDEFICILEDLNNEDAAESIAKNIIAAFSKPFNLHHIEIHITTSIGISLYPYDGDCADALITNADSAMYRAKKSGRNQYEMAKVEVNAGAYERLLIENHLRNALDNEELYLDFQPQLDLKKDKIIGFEALLRWNHPDLGVIPPSEFIPIAEETGLILSIGDWVLKNACLQMKQCEKAGFTSLRISVNLSAQQFMQKNLVQKIRAVLLETEMNPHLLELEITEGMIIHDTDSAILVLQQLRDLGVQISIDDFGTGYSSLNYLKNLPVNTLKIDRSFIFDIDINPSSKALTTAIATLAHDLKLNVIAEGVETYKQLSFVKKSACDAIQGYYFSKPLHSDVVIEFLNKSKMVVQKNA
ncbi:EAL domain-containing protein [Bacillus sp. Marseille-P3661]|uniref:EAL domain-containing protein n=1 Tax=Bacillus sp. Marseille-P3661 TaxID=1936234 RepID=UPI000C84D450|nr:EAL domain-containing protein [Bacillus sp. Marseille-P3661]